MLLYQAITLSPTFNHQVYLEGHIKSAVINTSEESTGRQLYLISLLTCL